MDEKHLPIVSDCESLLLTDEQRSFCWFLTRIFIQIDYTLLRLNISIVDTSVYTLKAL